MRVLFINEKIPGTAECCIPFFYRKPDEPRDVEEPDEIDFMSGVEGDLVEILSEFKLIDKKKECSLELEVNDYAPEDKSKVLALLLNCIGDGLKYFSSTYELERTKEVSKEYYLDFCNIGLRGFFGDIPDTIYISLPIPDKKQNKNKIK